MPTHLDFSSTKSFRDFLITKTLNAPNGPQTFTEQNYIIQGTSDFANIDPGDVTTNLENQLLVPQTHNIFKPLEYWVTEYLNVIPRRANLALYPYFVPGDYNLVSIMATDNYDTESELFKFAADNIKNNEQGPVFARIQQNLYAATVGRVRLIDALNGNLSTALNIITGREPLIEYNTKITVGKTLPGKVVDFLGTITGVEFPFSTIPGQYLTDPRRPVVNRPEANTGGGRFIQDLTGALGSLVGIQRRPLHTRKPSDLLIEHSGQGPKQMLYDNLSFSTYAPNYTKNARSQNTSKIFNFIDNVAGGVNKLLGLDAPAGVAYIGDDRGNNVKFAMGDFNDNMVRGPWYLSFMFDEVETDLFQKDKNIIDGGNIGGKLLWISSNSQNKLGANNDEYSDESSDVDDSLSTKFTFRTDSILGKTQSILDTLPDGGGSRSHVANAIDQTSRVFSEGGVRMSKGSNIKYIDQFTGEESGVEYCRVWTKDRSYYNMSDLMKNEGLIRNQGIDAVGSVLDSPQNLNIYPNSNGNKDFQGSTNIVDNGNGFYAKKYMFSIENLAWKTSNIPGFTYDDLPYCERGANGGRVMWFPPYDLKVTEQNNARWDETLFLGRPEPVYTYQNTSRNGTISFKVLVDHPSVLNLLVREHFKDMSNEESDNYINAFFAGCEDIDFYDLIRRYTTLTKDDAQRIKDYLNKNKDADTITKYKAVFDPVEDDNLPEEQTPTGDNGGDDGDSNFNLTPTPLYFQNDAPSGGGLTSTVTYTQAYDKYVGFQSGYESDLKVGLHTLFSGTTAVSNKKNDMFLLYGKETAAASETSVLTGITLSSISGFFNDLQSKYTTYNNKLTEIKEKLEKKEVKSIEIELGSTTSSVADNDYNKKLSFRRSDSVIKDVLNKLKTSSATAPTVSWKSVDDSTLDPIPLKSLGYEELEGNIIFTKIENEGETGAGCENKDFKTSDNLKRTAPVTFTCRQTSIKITTTTLSPNDKKDGEVKPDDNKDPNLPKVNLIPYEEKSTSKKRPPIDELKRIIMKTLSECYYFKKFEEDSPVAFKSMREKLKYFHPAFHSMTPEGLNARLTFLNQCIRPGDTIPIKGVSDVNDLNARNTTFGPPPICVLRVGDFYHSKVAIRDVNITYDDGLWDLNPEGIGIQPMIANVTLQISFIGGHGLEKPVEMLQNALTSNFYANTEMYDARATATEDRSKFTKEFLEQLLDDYESEKTGVPNTNSGNNIKTGEYIGVKTTVYEDSTLEYSTLVEKVFSSLESYFTAYQKSLYDISLKYGDKISSIFFAPEYRTVSDYEVQTGSGVETIELLGEYTPSKSFSKYIDNFRELMRYRTENSNISTIIGLNKVLNDAQLLKSEQILEKFIDDLITEIGEEFESNKSITSVEKGRNELIQTLDKLNFIIEHNVDGFLTDIGSTETTLSGYTDGFYDKYESVIEHIQDRHSKFTEDLDVSYMFNLPKDTMTEEVYTELLEILLYDYKEDILALFKVGNSFSNKINKIDRKLTRFVDKPKAIDVNLKKFPVKKDTNPIIYTIGDEDGEFDTTEKEEFTKIMSSKVALMNKLNYYKNGK